MITFITKNKTFNDIFILNKEHLISLHDVKNENRVAVGLISRQTFFIDFEPNGLRNATELFHIN